MFNNSIVQRLLYSFTGVENEETLHTWILSCCKRGFPIRVSDLQFTVEGIIHSLPLATRTCLSFSNGVPSKGWYYKFLERHPTVSLKKAEYLSASRAKVTEGRIRRWFEEVHEILEEEGFLEVLQDPSRLFNCDETAVWLNPSGRRVLTKKGEVAYAVNTNDDKMNVTVLFTVRADGEFVWPMYVHKGERVTSNYKSRLPPTWKGKATKKGWMTVEAFLFYITDVFDAYLSATNVKKPVILFVDGHVSHLSMDVTEYCVKSGIILICLLAFTTHLLQPLDLAVFKPMKEMWKTTVGHFRFVNQRDPCKYEIPGLVQELLDKYPLDRSVINGFRKAGLFPWNPSAVDYTKCAFSTESNPWLEDDEEDRARPEPVRKTFLELFEENIDSTVLDEFRNSLSDYSWKGSIDKKALFEMWVGLHRNNESFVPAESNCTSASVSTSAYPMSSVHANEEDEVVITLTSSNIICLYSFINYVNDT